MKDSNGIDSEGHQGSEFSVQSANKRRESFELAQTELRQYIEPLPPIETELGVSDVLSPIRTKQAQIDMENVHLESLQESYRTLAKQEADASGFEIAHFNAAFQELYAQMEQTRQTIQEARDELIKLQDLARPLLEPVIARRAEALAGMPYIQPEQFERGRVSWAKKELNDEYTEESEYEIPVDHVVSLNRFSNWDNSASPTNKKNPRTKIKHPGALPSYEYVRHMAMVIALGEFDQQEEGADSIDVDAYRTPDGDHVFLVMRGMHRASAHKLLGRTTFRAIINS